MTDQTAPENLELLALGMPVRNLKEVIDTGLFEGCTMDLFFEGGHFRIKDVFMEMKLGTLVINTDRTKGPMLQWRNGAWKRARRKGFDMHLNMHAVPVAIHDQEGKLILVTLVHKTLEEKPAMFVLYRAGRNPTEEDLQVIEWPEGLQPTLGGRGFAKKHN